MKTYWLFALVVVSIVIAVLLATALTSFTRVSDSALADVATPGASVGAGFSRPSVAGTNYLPIVFLNSATAGGAWLLAGNAGTNWLTDFLGTTDNMTLTLRVSNTVAYRIVPVVDPFYGLSPVVIGGAAENAVSPGLFGATIAGGGVAGYGNVITGTGSFATIAGGAGNTASGIFATVGGGDINRASGSDATVGGGYGNIASGPAATVGGGGYNEASGHLATIGGGANNTASGELATVPGGYLNVVSGNFSLAAGCHANAKDNGAFVWSDGTCIGAGSTGPNQFVIMASGGIRIAGAGISTTTPVFIWRATAESIGGFKNDSTFIDNALTNGDPNAILIATQNYSAGSPPLPNNHPIGVYYDSGYNKWGIFNQDAFTMTVGLAFNVLVVKP